MSDSQHGVFKNDPEHLEGYLMKTVEVEIKGVAEKKKGIVYTIDPVTESIVLSLINGDTMDIAVIMGHSVKSITILPDTPEHPDQIATTNRLTEAFFSFDHQTMTPRAVIKRKLKIYDWMKKNRLPVSLTGENEEVIRVMDSVDILPPYSIHQCLSDNEMVLERVQDLIKSLPVKGSKDTGETDESVKDEKVSESDN